VTLRGDGDLHGFATRVAQMPGIVTAEVVDSEAAAPVVHLTTDDAGAAIATIVATAAGDGIAITGIEVHEPNLEAVFLHLTGRALRDRAE
jgi:ABC-2 type transport system ATP-binding protein